jgi:hypothetical protein
VKEFDILDPRVVNVFVSDPAARRAVSFLMTPLVQPKLFCNGYSPLPPLRRRRMARCWAMGNNQHGDIGYCAKQPITCFYSATVGQENADQYRRNAGHLVSRLCANQSFQGLRTTRDPFD